MRLCSAFSAGLGITLAFQIGCGGSTDGPGGGSPTSSASAAACGMSGYSPCCGNNL